MIVYVAIEDERFELDVIPGFLESFGELLATGKADHSVIKEIFRQIQYVSRHSAELHARYRDRTAIISGEEVVYAADNWYEAQQWIQSELPDVPYYAVEFTAGQEGPSSLGFDAGSLHGAGVS